MYTTRSGLRLHLSSPLFACLTVLSWLLWVMVGGLVGLLSTVFLVYGGLDAEWASVIAWWSLLVVATGWTFAAVAAVSVLVVLSHRVTESDVPVGRTDRVVASSTWARMVVLSCLASIIGATIAKKMDWGLLDGAVVALTLAVCIRTAAFGAKAASRELRRVRAVSSSTPMFVQPGGYAGDIDSAWFRRRYGRDWAQPEVVVHRGTANQFAEEAEAHARMLHLTGRCISWLFGAIAIATMFAAFRLQDSSIWNAVLAGIVVAPALGGWMLEQRAPRYADFAEDYRTVWKALKPRECGTDPLPRPIIDAPVA